MCIWYIIIYYWFDVHFYVLYYSDSESEYKSEYEFSTSIMNDFETSMPLMDTDFRQLTMDTHATLKLSSMQPKTLNDHLSKYYKKMYEWNFDAFEYMNDPLFKGRGLTLLAYYLFKQTGLLDNILGISKQCLFLFFKNVEQGYLNNPYHNSIHACDVLVSTFYLMQNDLCKNNFTIYDKFSAYVASIVHDIGHNGLNNTFHVNTASNLALLYEDVSVLENMHVTETFRILNKKQCNWMLLLPISLRRYISKCIRQIVMSTG